MIFQEVGERRQQLAGVLAQDQRLVDLVQQIVGRSLVLGMRIERQGIAGGGPFQRARVGSAEREHEPRATRPQGRKHAVS